MRVVVLACFFLSGASGLILEMLWTRMLTLVFGSTTPAVSTVLTTLMGATLPFLARHFVTRPWELRRIGLRIGTLYSVNLFGAVAGAFFAGFVFLPTIGLRWTNVTAASFDLVLAGAILLAHRYLPKDAEEGVSIDERLDAAAAAANLEGSVLPTAPALDDRSRRAALVAFAVSGATAMMLQVLWTRALAVLLGS